jgi:RNA polymerase sigma-70 factor (family 1)
VPPESIYNDKELLLLVAQGNETAFKELFERYYPKLYQAGIMLTRMKDSAEELVQDVFLKIWLKREQLPGIENFESYLFIVARNHYYFALQRQIKLQKITREIGRTTPPYSTDTEDQIMRADYRKIMEQAIRRLPPKQQEVYRLSKIEGFTRDEIAAKMQIQPYTVKEHLGKALKSVRAYFMVHSDLFPPGFLLVFSFWLFLPCV